MSRTWKITVDEDELKALIRYHSDIHGSYQYDPNTDRSSRIHHLTKRLNKKDEPEIEKNDYEAEQASAQTTVPSVWD